MADLVYPINYYRNNIPIVDNIEDESLCCNPSFEDNFEECLEFVDDLLKDILNFKQAGIEIDKHLVEYALCIKRDLIEAYIKLKTFKED